MFTTLNPAPRRLRHVFAAACATGALAFGTSAQATDLPGADLYLGAGIGQSNADVSASDLGVSDFDKKDMGWKVFVGGRFLSMAGAELDYIDFGKPDGSNAEVKYKALAGFGLFYLPIPVPILDVYAKAGVARLDSHLHVNTSSLTTRDTKFAYGAGVQLKFGSFAIRGEYEQYKVDDTKPTMLTLAFSKSLL